MCSFVFGELTQPVSSNNVVVDRLIYTLPLPVAAAGVSVFALVRVLRRPGEFKGVHWALLGLALNFWVVMVTLLFALYGD